MIKAIMVTTVVIDQSDLATCGLIAKIYMLYRGGSAAEWLERRIAFEGPFLTGVILGSTRFNSFMLLANFCLPLGVSTVIFIYNI